MSPLKIDLLAGRRNNGSQASTGRSPAKLLTSLLTMAGIFVFSFGFGRLSLSATATAALAELPIIKQMHLIGSPDRQLLGESDDRINVLLLGMGGEGHEGPLLTDTIMVASFQPSTSKVALLSIPRDLLVPLPNAGWRKINAANAFGELESPGRGGDAARETVEGLLGLDIPYYVRVDFSGFKTLVDDIGGVDIYVERSFNDYSYPAANYLYRTVSFQQGLQHLTGDEALEYARSRHGNNGEGSDFARAKRQQKVLAAVKDKTLTFSILKNPSTISNLLAELQSNVTTNMQIGEILRLAKMARAVDPSTVIHKVLDDRSDSPLIATFINGAYVLVPRRDDWSEIRQLAADMFTSDTSDVTVVQAPKTEIAATPKIEIRNGSGKTGLAQTLARKLTDAGFAVVKIGNTDSFDSNKSVVRKTTIYDLCSGQKGAALENLKQTLGFDVETVVSPLPPATGAAAADFLIILGQDSPDQEQT